MPATAQTIPVTKTVFDLDIFDEVSLIKNLDFVPAENTSEVLERIGGDASKMLELLNEGLRAELVRNARSEKSGWHTFELDAEGEETEKVNGPYTGTPADMKAVNSLKLTLAKTVFGFSKEMTKPEKQKAKADAIEMIKSTPAIKAGLQKAAAKEAKVSE